MPSVSLRPAGFCHDDNDRPGLKILYQTAIHSQFSCRRSWSNPLPPCSGHVPCIQCVVEVVAPRSIVLCFADQHITFPAPNVGGGCKLTVLQPLLPPPVSSKRIPHGWMKVSGNASDITDKLISNVTAHASPPSYGRECLLVYGQPNSGLSQTFATFTLIYSIFYTNLTKGSYTSHNLCRLAWTPAAFSYQMGNPVIPVDSNYINRFCFIAADRVGCTSQGMV